MLERFDCHRLKARGLNHAVWIGGDGPPVLLLHGYPQTHATWLHVAPVLAQRFTVVAPDLRGYGASDAPDDDDGHTVFSKREMAADQVAIMSQLGFHEYTVVGHDRGARVTYRMALDYPERVTRLCSLDVVPTYDTWAGFDHESGLGTFHWTFLAQPSPLPETMIGHDPVYFLRWLLRRWAAPGFEFDAAAMREYERAFSRPEVIAATCADYRAGATTDLAHDREDRETGRKIACPLLCLWGEKEGFAEQGGRTPLDIWRDWCAGPVSGKSVASGHFLPEEAPDAVLESLTSFLTV
ncbi:MAG: alpha/beta hydrolase [Gammaproteobacteria bacterium]|nr:alpha/beta hydrolase [Gammaproteobacteria bacterium]